MTTIEPLTLADHEAWLSLWQGYLAFYRRSLSEDATALAFTRLIDSGASGLHGALLRNREGTATGFVHWLTHPATWTDGPYCYLEDLYVDPAARGAGAGRAMIEHVRAWAVERGCAKLYWLTQEHNTTARALYDRVADRSGFLQYQITF